MENNKNRVLIFFVLSMGMLFVARWLAPPPPPPVNKTVTPPATTSAPPTPGPNTGTVQVPSGDIEAERSEPDILEQTELYTATFSNALLKSYKLKKFSDSHGSGVDLVNQKEGPELGWPLTLDTGDPARNAKLAAARFKGKKEGSTVVYEWASGGLYALKKVTFDEKTYTFSIETRVAQDGKPVPHWIQWPAGFGDNGVQGGGLYCWIGWGNCDDTHRQVIVDSTPVAEPGAAEPTTKFERAQPEGGQLAKGVEGQKRQPVAGAPLEKTSKRVGMEDQFFLLMMTLPQSAVARFTKTTVELDSRPVGLIGMNIPMQSGAVRVYAGPKDKAILEETDKKLSGIVDFGTFAIITAPLTKALMWLHGYIGNFGWSIMLLTLGINLAFFPLRLKQQLSMQKLQKIQPQMRTLQDKFKKLKTGDPRRNEVQAEIMELYKENGVNPLSGCLPLLLQLPFLWAFYNVLSMTIELRGSPWILWIHDLSQKDPYFVLPVLMALSMFMMQRMTPAAAGVDPAQQKMMAIMPLVMGFMFLSYPSGLMVYWLTSNVIGITQQLLISRFWPTKTEKAAVARG